VNTIVNMRLTTLVGVLVLDGSLHGAAATSSNHSQVARCAAACTTLARTVGHIDYFNDTKYAQEQVYWSQQQQQTFPECRFTPTSAQQVSAAIREVRKTQCQFAVKSGGHASFVGASNIQDGLTIDLSGLRSISVSADKKTTSTGTGNRWEDLYAYLDPRNLAVIGGRNGDIGVGGLTLGGGISFFSGFYGWALDNVNSYEVVLADGRIVNANNKTNTDLYFALRGGGNNFGIVTRLDLNTFSHGQMWGGSTVYPVTANTSIYDAYYWFNKNAIQDPKAALIVSAACVPGLGCFFSNNYEYIDPVVEPPIFENFTSIPNISDTSRITDLLNLTVELKNTQPPGFRQSFWTLTFKNDAKLLSDIFQIWQTDIQPILNITSFLPALVFQPLTVPVIQKFAKNGGNALGITDEDGPLTIMDIDFQWADKKEDAQVLSIMRGIIDKSIALAESRNLSNRYLYQNYAYIEQDVFSGYGAANKARLLKIQSKYDPQNVFTELQPGYFKLRKAGHSHGY